MAIPTLDLNLAPPGKMRMPFIQGGGLESGTSLSGVDNAIDLTGGGRVSVSYQQIALGNVSPAGLKYWSQLAGILNSRVRSIVVPLMTDFIMPGGFTATLAQNAPVNSGTIAIALSGIQPSDSPLTGGEWFGIYAPARGNRCHVITDIDAAQVNGDGTATYTVGIAPPLRQGYANGAALDFVRPTCLMRLAPSAQLTVDLEPGWWGTPDVDFIESFGST